MAGTRVVGRDGWDHNDRMAITGDGENTENTERSGTTGELRPGGARTPAEYVALLRRLKEHSGLTFRQLEQKAAARGDVLARSTLADVLRRDALPRAEVVAALVRACGAGKDESAWLTARERIASTAGVVEGESSDSPDSPDSPASSSGSSGSRTRTASLAAVASLGTVALLVIGALVLLPQDGESPAAEDAGGQASGTSTPVGPGPAPGLSRIRPVRAPELCLTDGEAHVESGASKVVAVQRPCGEAVPPKTYLLKSDDGLYRIQWDHPDPDKGKGCLTLLTDGEFRQMLEPRNDCQVPGPSQLFRIERAEGTADGWLLRPEQADDMCLGIRGNADEANAVAVAENCTEKEKGADVLAQVFLIGRG